MRNSFLIPHLLCFIAGIILSGKFSQFQQMNFSFLIFSIFSMLSILLILRKNYWFFYMLFFLLGFILSHFQIHERSIDIKEDKIDLTVILKKTNASEKGISLYGKVIHSKKFEALNTKNIYIFLRTQTANNYHSGDILSCKNIRLQALEPKNLPFEFDFDHFLLNQNISYKAFVWNEEEIQKLGTTNSIFNHFEYLNRKWQSAFNNAFNFMTTTAILSALSLGDKSKLDDMTKSAFADTGSMHILAVSGLHVGIIYLIIQSFCTFLFFPFKMKKWICWIIGILVIWIFTGISGSSPATIRAALMLSIYSTGTVLQSRTKILHTIALVAFILVCRNPKLIYQLSFQFSFIALSSIVIFQPLIQSIYLPKNKILSYFLQLFYLSFAVQILTFPITLYYFNQFPSYFFLSGIIAVPFAGLLLSMICLFIFLHTCFQWVPPILIDIIELTTQLLLYLLEKISTFPYSTFRIDRIYFYDFVFYYAIVLFVFKIITGKLKFKKIAWLGVIFLFWFCCSSLQIQHVAQQKVLIKKTIAKQELYCFIDGHQCIALTPSKKAKSQWTTTLIDIKKYYRTNKVRLVNEKEFFNACHIDKTQLNTEDYGIIKSDFWQTSIIAKFLGS